MNKKKERSVEKMSNGLHLILPTINENKLLYKVILQSNISHLSLNALKGGK